jgi:hypothetical protein
MSNKGVSPPHTTGPSLFIPVPLPLPIRFEESKTDESRSAPEDVLQRLSKFPAYPPCRHRREKTMAAPHNASSATQRPPLHDVRPPNCFWTQEHMRCDDGSPPPPQATPPLEVFVSNMTAADSNIKVPHE